MKIIGKIGMTWLALIVFFVSVLLGLFGCYAFTLCWPIGVLVLMMSVGAIGWCIYSIWEIWTDR